jgi:tRNA-dihydrouridine synthase B
MQIGALHLRNPTVLAPLAGITHLPFRLLAREAGCGLVCSEMVSADGLVHGSRNTLDMLRSTPAEKPLAVQIFGSDPAVMAAAAAMVEESGADVLDINFGCAVKKVVKLGAGVALMRMPRQAETLLQAVRKAVRIPVTIKIRSGWDRSGGEALALGKIAEDCGVDAVTIHPRTAAQKFSGQADWGLIGALKRSLSIPVIGNGDILSAEDALRMMTLTGCDAVMIGRRAIGDPRIFAAIASRLQGTVPPPDSLDQRLAVMCRYVETTLSVYGENLALRLVRNRLGWFARGMRYGSLLRQDALQIQSIDEAWQVIESFRGRAVKQGLNT